MSKLIGKAIGTLLAVALAVVFWSWVILGTGVGLLRKVHRGHSR